MGIKIVKTIKLTSSSDQDQTHEKNERNHFELSVTLSLLGMLIE